MNAQAIAERTEGPAAIEVVAAPAKTPMEMAYALIQGGADLGSVKEMLAMSRELAADAARMAFDAAMSEAKAEIPPILKNREVDFTSAKGRTNYRHEDLGEIARTVDPILARHGLSYRFRTEQDGPSVKVTCIVAHREGHAEENFITAPRDESGNKNSIQAIGSTITYLQRYTLKSSLGLAASSDDDGKKAGEAEVETISMEQIEELQDLIEKAGSTVEGFCKVGKVPSLADLRAADFDRAKSWLNDRIKAKAKADA